MADRRILEMRLSGGVSNTDPDLSLGGVKSTTLATEAQNFVLGSGGIGGVTEVNAFGNDLNAAVSVDGRATYTNTGTTLKYEFPAFAATFGTPIDISSDGRYTICDVNDRSCIVVDVVAASLPGIDTTKAAAITPINNLLFDNVSSAEAGAGMTDYRCAYVHNADGVDTFTGVEVYIETQPDGDNTINIGLDPAGVGDGSVSGIATTIADELSVPAGVTFSAPALGTPLTIGNLTTGQSQAIWFRRVQASASTTQLASDGFTLCFLIF